MVQDKSYTYNGKLIADLPVSLIIMRVVSLVTLCDLLHSCQGVQCSLQPHAEIQQNYVHKVMRTYMSRCELTHRS